MINYQIPGNTANNSLLIRFIDSNDGTPETGVTAATSGLSLVYRREGANAVTMANLANLASGAAAFSANGLIHIDNGWVRVDVPDAAIALGSKGCLLSGTATGMVVIGSYVQITDPANTAIHGTNVVSINANAITATAIATNAITSTEIADGAITAAKFAANAIAAGTIADGAIDAATFAANAITAAAIADSAIDIATFAADAKTGSYINAQVKAQDNIAFGALQLANLNAATPASVGTANTVAALGANVITAASIADGAIDAATFAANAITAAAIADSAIDIATFAADVKTGSNLNVQVKASDNIAFTALQLANLNSATPASVGTANTVAALAANCITAASIAADAGTEIAAAMFTADAGVYATAHANSVVKQTSDNASGSGATAAEVRIEMDANSTKLATIATDTTTDIPALIDALPTAAEVAAAMFSANAGTYAGAHANSVVKQTSDNASGSGATAAEVRAEMDANSTQLAAIVGDTNELQTDWVNGGRLDLLIDGIKTKTDTIPASPAAVGSAMTLAANAVTAASLDPDAGTELGTAVWATAARTLTSNANFNDPTAASVADAVWDEISTGHTDAGKAGQQLWTDVDAVVANTAALVTGVNVSTIAANAITAASIAADSGTEIGTAVWSTAARTLTGAANITSTGGTTVPQTGDSFARIGAPAGANLAADIAAIEAQTDDIGVAGAGLSAVPWNAAWAANVEAAVDAAFENAIPASPTANSINAYLQKMKWVLTNKMTIEESSANTVIFKDDGTTPAYSVAAMFASDAGTTTRKAAA